MKENEAPENCPSPILSDKQRLAKALELIESCIMDFEKLKPFIGEAADKVAAMYREELNKLQCHYN